MKFSKSNLFLTLISASFLVCSDALGMKQTFRYGNYKNIAFSASIGGASHINWVLSIGDELGLRGHNVSFLTTTEETQFGQPYKNLNTVDIGPTAAPYDKVQFLKEMSTGKDLSSFLPKVIALMTKYYENEYNELLSYFKINKVDLVLCDFIMSVCVDAATSLKIPYIITSAMDTTTESSAPYVNNDMNVNGDFSTEFQSFSDRFRQKFISPWIALYHFWPHLQDISARKRALGIEVKLEAPDDTWKDSMKLVNCLFGFIPARPVGSMAEYVGPIIPKQYKPLTDDLEEYLNAHERLVYVAFGQSAVPSEENIKLVLTSILESIEIGTFDGFLWSTVHSADLFPVTITTSSNTIYNVEEMFGLLNPHARMIQWVPQTAILLHPSTVLFISHGGLGSWYESMYAAKPMAVFPFFGDQPGNALTIERDGLGGYLRADAPIEEAVALFKKVAVNKVIRGNLKRIQALVQIHSEHGIIRGADVVEEVAYTHKDGKLPHRETADRRMPYLKSSNIDLYASFFSMLAVGLSLTIYTSFKTYNATLTLISIITSKQKIKII